MKKTFVAVLLSLLCWVTTFAQTASPKISFGVLRSNFSTNYYPWYPSRVWRTGWWATIEASPSIITRWINMNLGLSYQERMPLEVFQFPKAGGLTSVAESVIFAKFPSNPQNELFDTGNYLRIPNFKYLTLEAIPSVTFGKKLSVSLGVGLFGSILLNRTQMAITKEDLPAVEPLFDVKNIVNTPVLYNRFDAGWMPKINMQYAFSQRFSLGLQFKSYQSFVRLNDTFVTPFSIMKWKAYAYGLSVQYHLGRD